MSNISRIALVGYRATGKTTLGRLIAKYINWSFVDMDEMLTERLGMSIASWVSMKGWESFRRSESELLKELSGRERIVVSTGGGVVEDPENRELLRKSFFVLWLRACPKNICRRLKQDLVSIDQRPSLTGAGILEEVETVLKRREPLYSSVAHLIIKTDEDGPEELAKHVITNLNIQADIAGNVTLYPESKRGNGLHS